MYLSKKNFIKVLLCLSVVCLAKVAAHAQDTIYLAKKGERPFMICFKPEKTVTKTMMIVCSGGSYGGTADHVEGIPAAKLLAQKGITAYLLDYRLPNGRDSVPLADAQKAIMYLRNNTENSSVGIMGFSAGGHLVSTIATHFNEDFSGINAKANLRPDFAILVYPVISMQDELTHAGSQHNLLGENPTAADKQRFSNELQVTDNTPPVFIVHALDDRVVKINNSLLFIAALRAHKVPVETFIYAKGGHGFGIHNSTVETQWTDVAIPWIIKQGNGK